MKLELNALMLGLIAAATLSLGGCGGDSDSPSTTVPVTGGEAPPTASPSTGSENPGVETADPIAVDGQPVTVEAAKLAQKSGVWAERYELYAEPLPVGSTATGVAAISGSSVSSWQYVSDEEIVVDDCAGEGPVTMNLVEFNTFDTVDEANDEAEDPAPYEICAGGVERELYAVSDTHYRANLTCQGQRIGALEMFQVSSQPVFNQGTLLFSTDSQGNFNSSNGVCGSIVNGLGSEAHVGHFEIVAPYGDDARVQLSVMTFSGLRTGIHEIGGGLVNGTFFDISTISLSDPLFFEGPRAYPSEGTLTVETIDTYSVSGSFDMTTDGGEKVQGTFDLNLR